MIKQLRIMKKDELALALYDAKLDGVPTKVLIQKVKTLTKDVVKYWIQIGNAKHSVSKKIASNAIARPWSTPIEYLPTKYLAKY